MKFNNIKNIILCGALAVFAGTSCVDMDIPPKNIVTSDDLLSNESGLDIYLSRMYSHMPFEDFKYMGEWGFNYNGWLNACGIEGTGEATNRDGICRAFTSEGTPYWGMAFETLRDANFMIETLPQYQGNFPEVTYNHYLGEAYYVRATVFYAMARRFGGIPLVTKVIQYPADEAELEVPRASEEETWNQILADYDKAAELMMPNSIKTGQSNRWVALAWKSEAALYAGCVAKYNETVPGRLTGLGEKTGVRVIGFDENSWESASKRYFTEAYKAASEIIQHGPYSLYKKKWEAGNSDAMKQNMIDMFSDLTSPENIQVKEYLYPTTTHAYDAYSAPFIFRSPLCSGVCLTADFIELYEGFDRYPDGTLKVTTGDSNTQGEYIMYDHVADFYKNAEPRLRAYAIFPDDMFKNQRIEIYTGVYTGSAPVKPLFSDYSYSARNTKYQNLPAYNDQPQTLFLASASGNDNKMVTLPDGSQMRAAGENGPFFSNGESCMTGVYGRKWLKDDPSFTAREGNSDQPFIIFRYAEVLLNAAEAAVELGLAGVQSPDGTDMMAVATKAINDIRERAGASLLQGSLNASIDSRNIVRKERRKEMAFENKTKWDLRRWRVNHYEGRDGFWGEERDKTMYSNNNQYAFRGVYPFYCAETGKWFYDVHFQIVGEKTFSYSILDYYFEIPGGEVAKSMYIDQQPNR